MQNRPNHRSMKLAFRPPSQDALLVKLFSVTITHTYYSLNDGLCPDFSVEPTPTSAKLMSQLGMAMRADPYGFSIFIQSGREDDLLAYLLANAQGSPAAPEYWERLSFSLRLKQLQFVDVTELPLATRTTQSNLYGCNLQAHQEGELAVLSAGQYMGGASLYPIVAKEVSFSLPDGAAYVYVTDISGAVVIAPEGDLQSQGRASLDFSTLPYDLYTICLLDAQKQPYTAGKFPWTVLYATPQANSMVLLDLLFTQPTPQSGGIYPVTSLFGAEDPTLVKLAYRLPFETRHTFWQYFVVSQDPGGILEDLDIAGPGTVFHQLQPVVLPDGSLATPFQSDQALPLRQKSQQRFHLKGRRRDANGHENAIWIARLPVAASAPVWPSPDQRFSSGISEIFVYV